MRRSLPEHSNGSVIGGGPGWRENVIQRSSLRSKGGGAVAGPGL
jgi:hypothetical protein